MRTRQVLLAAALLAASAGAVAVAQNTATYDAEQLPAIKGKVAQYSLTPRGDVDGLILDDGTEVHLPPHLGVQLVFAVKPGDAVTVHGLKARAIPMVQAMSVTNDATGKSVADLGPGQGGPRGARGPAESLTAQGTVKAQLHGPQGDMNGVLLTDGTIVRLPPPEAQRLAGILSPGHTVYVEGVGQKTAIGSIIAARAIGPDQAKLAQIEGPPHGFGKGRRPPPPWGTDAPPPSPGAPPDAPPL